MALKCARTKYSGDKIYKEIFPKYNGDNFMLILVTIFSLSRTLEWRQFLSNGENAFDPHPKSRATPFVANDWVTLSYLFFS
jgi:hypothetical protein